MPLYNKNNIKTIGVLECSFNKKDYIELTTFDGGILIKSVTIDDDDDGILVKSVINDDDDGANLIKSVTIDDDYGANLIKTSDIVLNVENIQKLHKILDRYLIDKLLGD